MSRARTRVSARPFRCSCAALAALLAHGMCASPSLAAPPSRIVVVIEENHSFSQVIGNPAAPFINSLAANGASFTSFYAITHPSQPNYLEFFSGDNQGVTSDSLPTGTPFTTPNLAAAMLAAGWTFGGYCQGLPAVGSNIESSGSYDRKHNPWVNWQNTPQGANQLAPGVNMPFTMFPADYSQLPTLSFVIPDELHNMHTGTIAQADAWLSSNLAGYAAWAMENNGLLIITWDEDASNDGNRIPTILYGPMVRQGIVDSTWTLHNLQRTIAELYGAAGSGSGTRVEPIIGAFADDRAVTTVGFRSGEAGYAGAVDTYIESGAPNAGHGAGTINVADGSPLSQCLIRFDGVVGSGESQVPAGARIHSAKLMILTGATSGDQSASEMRLHAMRVDWNDASTWNSLAGGVSANGIEASTASTFDFTPGSRDTWAVFDVTPDIRDLAIGSGGDHGWVILPTGTDGWRWNSSESPVLADRPRLEITYSCPADFDGSGFVDIEDYGVFVQVFEAGADEADFDQSGFVDIEDFTAFVLAFEAGC